MKRVTTGVNQQRRVFLRTGIAAAMTPLLPGTAFSQAADLPTGPIKIVLPTAAGGQADVIARLIADRVGPAIDRTFVIESRPGAGGLIAGEFVARAAPDGNTLLFVTGGHTILPGLYAKTIKFDAVKDFAFVCQITEASFAIAVATDHPAKSFTELLEMSKREPGKRTFSSVGAGSTQHLIGEIAQPQFGVQWTHIPYAGGAMPLNDVMAGRVDMSIDSMLTILPLAEGGRMRVLAVTSVKRQDLLPNVPSFGELSPGFSVGTFLALAAPARTPPAIVARLNREIAKAVAADATRDRLRALGNTAKSGTPEELTQTVAQYVERWTGVINKLGLAR
jgi:tripartite-type tricarboxylate transporter receptor subunit TctC